MDWQSLIGPAVVAAGISALVAWVSTSRRFAVDRELAERKISADLKLAERKFAFDKKLAEHKVELDAALAEKKFALDVELGSWKRRYELCEQVMMGFLEARDALAWIRSRGIFGGEGKTRKAIEPESDKLKERRDLAFVPLERLHNERELFAKLRTLRYTFAAHFGESAAQPFSTIAEICSQVSSAASIMLQMTTADEPREFIEGMRPLREQLGWGHRPDETDRKIDEAVAAIEALCTPVLARKPEP